MWLSCLVAHQQRKTICFCCACNLAWINNTTISISRLRPDAISSVIGLFWVHNESLHCTVLILVNESTNEIDRGFHWLWKRRGSNHGSKLRKIPWIPCRPPNECMKDPIESSWVCTCRFGAQSARRNTSTKSKEIHIPVRNRQPTSIWYVVNVIADPTHTHTHTHTCTYYSPSHLSTSSQLFWQDQWAPEKSILPLIYYY